MERFSNLVIRASAGTGKTFQLANRFLGLLICGVPLDQILAVTFTRKAAGEILDRVLLRLAEAASDDQKCATLAQDIGEKGLTVKQCRGLLRDVIRQLHRLRIGTLDSFFAQLAGSFSLELGLPPGWTIVEQVQEERLRDEAVALILRDHSARDIARIMHLMSKGDVDRSVAELIRETVKNLHSIFLDCPSAAWERFPDVRPMPNELFNKTVGCLSELSVSGVKLSDAHSQSLDFLRRGDWEGFLGKGLPKQLANGKSTYYKAPISEELSGPYSELVKHARAIVIKQLASQTKATRELLERFDEVYQRHRRVARAMRFDDVARKLAERFQSGAADNHGFRLDMSLNHILLDEFQDTSLVQWQVLRPFIDQATRRQTNVGQGAVRNETGPQSSFFCVGDIKQAIYGWRGGSSEIFNVVQKDVPRVKQSQLTQSYRSAPPIIETVNRIFTSLNAHPRLDRDARAIGDWQRAFVPHSTAKTELVGYSCLMVAPECEEGEEQACGTIRFAASQVAKIASQAPGRSIAVLTRRNSTITRVIHELRELHVRASEEGGNPLTDSAAVQLVLSLLKLSDHPGDTTARYHIACSPLGPIVAVTKDKRDQSASRFAQRLRRQLLTDGYGKTISQVVSRLLPFVRGRDQDRLSQLIELAHRHQSRLTLRASDFIRLVEMEQVPDPAPTDVRVTTIHKAKGLQFDIVVLPEWDMRWVGESPAVVVGRPDATLPVDRVCRYRNETIQALLPPELQELFTAHGYRAVTEMLCVMYVALTRAIHAMYMIVPPTSADRKSLPKSMLGLLRATLTNGSPLAPNAVPFECGDPNWTKRLPSVERYMVSATDRVEQPQEIKLAPSLVNSPSLEHTSPSELEGGPLVKALDLLRLDNAPSLTRGTILHAWFEQIYWIEVGSPNDAELRKIATALGADGISIDNLLADFQSMLKHSEISDLLSPTYYDFRRNPQWRETLSDWPWESLRFELRHEQRILTRSNSELVSGAIDRLVLIYSGDKLLGADIIDFKTDTISDKNSEALRLRTEFYQPQLSAYREAVAKMFRLEIRQVAARLAFVSVGQVVVSGSAVGSKQLTLF